MTWRANVTRKALCKTTENQPSLRRMLSASRIALRGAKTNMHLIEKYEVDIICPTSGPRGPGKPSGPFSPGLPYWKCSQIINIHSNKFIILLLIQYVQSCLNCKHSVHTVKIVAVYCFILPSVCVFYLFLSFLFLFSIQYVHNALKKLIFLKLRYKSSELLELR